MNEFAQKAMQAGAASLGNATNAAYQQIADAPQQTVAEAIMQRLAVIHAKLDNNTGRIIELGSRAFGGNPVGQQVGKTAGQPTPQPAGHLSNISSLLDAIDHIVSTQQDAITFVERIA